jgi:hypothetical protein
MMWRATRKRTPGLYLGNVLKGLPYGLIVAALGALGVDVLKLNIADPGAWIAVMVVAALGAWGGPKLLSTILPQPSRA